MRKIGTNLHAKGGLTHEAYIRTIAGLGFDCIFTGVHEAKEQAQIADLCAAHGIECETLHAPFGHINDIWRDTDDGDVVERELLQTIDHCKIAGAGIAVVHLSSGLKPPPVTDIGRARFTRVVEYAAKNCIRIAFENQRFLSNISWAFETFIGENYGGTVGFCWDTGHEGCFTPGRRYMPLFGDRIICTHIQDNLCEFNKDLHYLPFDGNIDWNYVASALREAGYTGSLMLEGIASNSHRYDDMTPEEYLERAAAAMKRLRTLVDGEE